MKRDLESGGDGREPEGLPCITTFPSPGDNQAEWPAPLSMAEKRSENSEISGF
jgi:hypothetical protein